MVLHRDAGDHVDVANSNEEVADDEVAVLGVVGDAVQQGIFHKETWDAHDEEEADNHDNPSLEDEDGDEATVMGEGILGGHYAIALNACAVYHQA